MYECIFCRFAILVLQIVIWIRRRAESGWENLLSSRMCSRSSVELLGVIIPAGQVWSVGGGLGGYWQQWTQTFWMNPFRTVRIICFGRSLSKTCVVTFQVMRRRHERERALFTCNLIGKVCIDPRRSHALPDFSCSFCSLFAKSFPVASQARADQ